MVKKSVPNKFGFYYKIKFLEHSGFLRFTIHKKGKFFRCWPPAECLEFGTVNRKEDESPDEYVGRVKNAALDRIESVSKDFRTKEEVKSALNHDWNVMIEKMKSFGS